MLKRLILKNKFSLMFLFLLLTMVISTIGFCSWSIYKEFGVYSQNIVDPVCYIKRSTGNVNYYRVEDALDEAKSGEEIYCYIGKNPTITRNCEIKNGVSLIIPFDDNALYGQREFDGSTSFGDTENKVANLKNTLTIAKNVTLSVNNGKIKIGGQLGTKGTGLSGQTSGAYCQIVMSDNSKILFNNNSSNLIDAFGYIKEATKDNGSYIEMKGGEVKMPFVVYDFRGGTNTVGVYRKGISPFSVFDFPNISPKIKFEYNASITGYADLYASNQHNTTTIKILGKSNSLLNFSNSNSYLIAKRNQPDPLFNSDSSYTDGTYTRLDFYNGLNSGNLKMKVASATVSTQDVLFPFSFKFHVYLHNGDYNLDTKMKLMTGAKLVVDDGASLNINSEFTIYHEFSDRSEIGPLYPNKSEGEFIVKGDVNLNSTFAGNIKTINDKANDCYVYANAQNYSINSKEGSNTRKFNAYVGNITNQYTINEVGNIYLSDNGTISYNGLAKNNVYFSMNTDDFFIKAENLSNYTLEFNLEGGSIDGSAPSFTREYKMAKDSMVLKGFSVGEPYKKYYKFDGWFLADGTSAIGYTIKKGETLKLYAHYSLANFSINYFIEYDDDENKRYDTSAFKTTFNYDELDLDLPIPTDPGYSFYGWFLNEDLNNTISKITREIGYQDINLYGVFSDSTICKVTFDSNGHDDYFENLHSFNIVTSNPTKVEIPKSLYDYEPTKEYYLIGWEDENGKLFNNETYGALKNETLLLKAKWGNKFTLKYADRNNKQIGDIEYYKAGASAFIRGASEIGEENAIVEDIDPEKYKVAYTVIAWEDSDNNIVNFYDNYVIQQDTVLKGKYDFKNYIYFSIVKNESWLGGVTLYDVLQSAILNDSVDLLSGGAYVCNTDSIKFSIEGSRIVNRYLDIQFGNETKKRLKTYDKSVTDTSVFVLNFNDTTNEMSQYFDNLAQYSPIKFSATQSIR